MRSHSPFFIPRRWPWRAPACRLHPPRAPRQISDIRDVARELPNVSVQRAPARFTIGAQTGRDGSAGFKIRGLDGNRVLMPVDGVRQPCSYLFQSESAVGRDVVDIGLVKRIEVVRGPTSALYGSDGIAGMVNFITKDPADFLRDGKTLGGQARIGYEGDVDGVSSTQATLDAWTQPGRYAKLALVADF